MARRMIFRQLFDRTSCTYTYLLGDNITREALIIDPVLELVDRDLALINQLELKLRYAINTHCHADHITGSGEIKKRLNINGHTIVRSVISKSSKSKADFYINENDVIKCGQAIKLKVLSTPGHTNGCCSFVDEQNGMVFTGDTLLIRGCGRTDFQEGSASQLYDSIHNKLFVLPNYFQVFPAHDYNGQIVSTIEEEKKYNPRLTKSKQEFIDIMANLKLEKPKFIDVAVPANMLCGLH